jgi:Lon protease-like protein
MICPFAPREKQALLESPSLAERAKVLTVLLEMAVLEGAEPGAPLN